MKVNKTQQMIYLPADVTSKLRLLSKYRVYHDIDRANISDIVADALKAYFKRHKAEIETAEKEKAGVDNAQN